MHKNLITTFSFNKTNNMLDSLKGFQQIISDSAFGTFFTIYAKMRAEDVDGAADYYNLKDAVFYLQNFSGQVTLGIESVDHQIDMAYHEGIEEYIYFITINVKPLFYSPFYPTFNNELFDNVKNEELGNGDVLIGFDFEMKKQLSIRAYTEQKSEYRDDSLNKRYKLVFHLAYQSNNDFICKKDDYKKSLFLDDKSFGRFGEAVITNDLPIEIVGLDPVEVKPFPHFHNTYSSINSKTGKLGGGSSPKCHNGIVCHDLYA